MDNIITDEMKETLRKREEESRKFNFYDGSDEELNRLRNERDKACNEYERLQGLVDKRILELNDLSRFEGEYVRLTDDIQEVYIKVEHVKRLYNGCRLYGPEFMIVYEDTVGNQGDISDAYRKNIDNILSFNFSFDKDNEEYVYKNDNVEVISEGEYYEMIHLVSEKINNMVK